jgi:cyclophilin family peptidyl-prolyl cis-trans isomerase/HEAT repeat protein
MPKVEGGSGGADLMRTAADACGWVGVPRGGIRPLFVATVLAVGGTWGCGGDQVPREAPPAGFTVTVPLGDDLFEDARQLALVEALARREPAPLLEALGAEDPRLRVRAVHALAGFASPEVVPPLLPLLQDEDAQVRTRVAWALGVLPEGGQVPALAQALSEAVDPGLRQAFELRAERAVAWLSDSDSGTHARAHAVRILGQAGSPEALLPWAPALRSLLDAWEGSDPAAVELLPSLSALRDPDDLPRFLDHLREAPDWRVRMAAARALGSMWWIERDGVRTALFQALDDPSWAVGAAAATALVQGLWVPPEVLTRLADRLSEDPAVRWPVHLPTLWQIASFHDPEIVAEWTRRAAGSGAGPSAVHGGIEALGDAPPALLRELLLALTEDADPEIREVGMDGLARSWQRVAGPELPAEELVDRFLEALPSAPNALAVTLGLALGDLAIPDPRIEEALRAEIERRAAPGTGVVTEALARALDHRGDPAGRVVLAGLEAEPPLGIFDPEPLRGLGRHPTLRIQTDAGEIRVRLDTEAAPVTLSALLAQVADGLHDGVPFHRVEPGLLVQGGDISMLNGTGGPGYRLPTEPSWIPFQRGVMGMASLGVPDSGGSQFFILQRAQPQLDGRFTAVGWVVEGLEVLDRLRPGDRVIRVQVEPEAPAPLAASPVPNRSGHAPRAFLFPETES